MDWYDQQDLARYRKRRRKQKEYQQGYRERLAETKTPERDDVAAALMRVYVGILADDYRRVADLTRAVLAGLEANGYARAACVEQLTGMTRRERVRVAAARKRAEA